MELVEEEHVGESKLNKRERDLEEGRNSESPPDKKGKVDGEAGDAAASAAAAADESEEEQELDVETFDATKLVRNDDDRKMLESLPELEREAILADRFEKLKNAADMKRALRENE